MPGITIGVDDLEATVILDLSFSGHTLEAEVKRVLDVAQPRINSSIPSFFRPVADALMGILPTLANAVFAGTDHDVVKIEPISKQIGSDEVIVGIRPDRLSNGTVERDGLSVTGSVDVRVGPGVANVDSLR